MAGNKNSGGRNKKAAHIHLVNGTFRPDRHNPDDDVQAPTGTPEPPSTLSGDALAEWTRMVARMVRANTISTIDDAALYQYVELFAETEAIKADHIRLRKMQADLMAVATKQLTDDLLIETVKEILTLQHAIGRQVGQLRQGHMALRQFLVEFGMTPAARTRVKPSPSAPAAADPDDAFFGTSRGR